MKKYEFRADEALGNQILDFDRQQLCEFVVKLCEKVKADVGAGVCRGGIYPDNISLSGKGELAIGRASASDWQGQELQFLPPEFYWNGRPGPAADVYSIGMLLYYALSGGKLPFDGSCRDPQLRRMSGDEFEIPASFGRRLGDIVKKATAFKAADRYQSMDELRVMVESCLKNLYLNGTPSAEAIFNKSDDDLSELERLMVGIIEKEEELPLPEDEILAEVRVEESEESEEEAEEAEESPEDYGEEYGQFDEDEDEDCMERRPVSEDYYPGAQMRIPVLYEEEDPELEPVVLSGQSEVIPAVRYTREAERERRMREKVRKRRRRPVAVVLVLCALLVICAIIFSALIKDITRGRDSLIQMGNELKADAVTGVGTDLEDEGSVEAPTDGENGESTAPAATEQPSPTEEPVSDNVLNIQPDSVPDSYVPGGITGYIPGQPQHTEPPQESLEDGNDADSGFVQGPAYQVFVDNISWTDAQAKCVEMGGHLAVINDAEEFAEIVALAEENGLRYVWLGGHRENGMMVWEDGAHTVYENWAKGEPSFVDGGDGVAEDYVLLWNNRGWFYNDSRNDPCKDYPHMYNGCVAYICEMG